MMPLFALLSSAAAQDGGAPAAPGLLETLFPFLIILPIFYFLIIRPQQTARKKHIAMVDAVKRGDTVVTAGGLVGKVTKVGEGAEITVKVAENVEVQVMRATLSDVRAKGEPTKAEDGKN